MGIFDKKAGALFTTYHARLTFRDKIMGGTPKDPKIIQGWLRSKAGITDEEELKRALRKQLIELGADVNDKMTFDELVTASEGLANRLATGFKRDEHGLYIEGRYIKAMLKEATNIVFEGKKATDLKWTDKKTTRKFGLSYLAERTFVNPDHISLGVKEPNGTELFVGHTTGPDGPKSNLTLYEYVTRPTIAFDIMVMSDFVREDDWPQLWVLAQENGLGALRSQGFGRFDIVEWEKVKPAKVPAAFRAAMQSEREPVVA